MRWIMIVLTLAGTGLAFLARGPGLLGIGLLLGFIGLFGTVLSIAASRISSGTRPDTAMLSAEDLRAIRDRAQARQKQPPPLR